MIISKTIIKAVAGQLVKHFRLDKIMKYVFEDNKLDIEFKKMKKELKELKKKLNKLIKKQGDKNG